MASVADWFIGDNVAVQATVDDATGSPEAATVTVSVTGPDGNPVAVSTPTSTATGVYQAIVANVTKLGTYRVEWETTVGTFTKGSWYTFVVTSTGGSVVGPLASPSDVEDLWRPLADGEVSRIGNLIDKASARLRQQCPFDVDARIALYAIDPKNPVALAPAIVADVVAGAVKRFLVNPDGVVTQTQADGPFSLSQSYVNRYDKTGSDVRGSVQITDSDIDQLRPASRSVTPQSIRMRPGNSVFPLGLAGPIDDVALRNRMLENTENVALTFDTDNP